MKLRAKICLYIFLVCSFVALGIIGYFVINKNDDSVMVGNRKFVTFNSVSGAYSYDIEVSNGTKSDTANYKVTKEENDDTINYLVEVTIDNQKIAEESYILTILNNYSDSDKIDCKITDYTINFFNNSNYPNEIYYPDTTLENVDKDIFCVIVVEYFDDIFTFDGNYTLVCIPKDEQNNEIKNNEDALLETQSYNYNAFFERDFEIRDKFYYYGKWYDYVIENEDELNAIVGYAILYRQSDINFYIDTNTINENNFYYLVYSAVNEYPEYTALENTFSTKIEGSIGYISNFEYYLDENFTKNYIDLQSVDSRAYQLALDSLYVPDQDFSPTYITKEDSGGRNFYINSSEVTDEVVVYNSEQLYMVVQNGARPIFVEGKSDIASQIYQTALDILTQINNSDLLTDYEKALNIYNYICSNIVYDYVTYDFMTIKKDFSIRNFGNYSCFYLEGVFLDFEGLDYHYAVCDGLSKAYSLMCNIEGIECFKVNGEAGGGNHAWNKIYFDEEDISGWYYVDTTWGQSVFNDSDGTQKQVGTHTYFLFKQDDYERTIIYPKNTEEIYPSSDFNYYEFTKVEYNGKLIDFYIESDEELLEILKWGNSQILNGESSIVLELKFSDEFNNNFSTSTISQLINSTSKEYKRQWFKDNGVDSSWEYLLLNGLVYNNQCYYIDLMMIRLF